VEQCWQVEGQRLPAPGAGSHDAGLIVPICKSTKYLGGRIDLELRKQSALGPHALAKQRSKSTSGLARQVQSTEHLFHLGAVQDAHWKATRLHKESKIRYQPCGGFPRTLFKLLAQVGE